MVERSFCLVLCVMTAMVAMTSQQRTLGRFKEVFAWKQLTYDIDGDILLDDRFAEDMEERERTKRSDGDILFVYDDDDILKYKKPKKQSNINNNPSPRSNDEINSLFIQYNNVPMGVERAGDVLFVSVPRRRYGIPSTLNYIDLRVTKSRSPPLRPYPNLRRSRTLTSVYRTRADVCNRLWMVDTGLLEIPNNQQQVQPPAIVIFDLNTSDEILRYRLKTSDLPAADTPTGLASITVDIDGDCDDAYAYIPDLTTNGIIVYSLRENDSWRLSNVYFHFNPVAATLTVANQTFQWSDGIFSITLSNPGVDGCRTAYFHPMISTHEFSVSTCVLKDKNLSSQSDYFKYYSIVGERGDRSQSTMHGYHKETGVVFFADIGRDGVSCWNSDKMMNSYNVHLLASDEKRMSYPADLHVTGDEVWTIANTLPKFGYSRLDPNEYNFYIYKGNVHQLIARTVCSP